METAAALLMALAASSLACWSAQRSSRHNSALSAAGLGGTARPATAGRPRLLPALQQGLERLGRRASPRPRKEVSRLLEESGTAWTPHFLQGLRMGAGTASSVLALPLGLVGLPLVPALFAAAYHLPMVLLKRQRARRLESMAYDLPEVVDLMAVLCFSGESLSQALRHSASVCVSPWAREEMGRLLQRMDMGESAAESLRNAASHPCREMRRFCRTLLRAEEFGAPVADTLEELAMEFRGGRREKERVRASRVSVLILFPLVFLILPSFLLLTVGGMILGHTL